MNLLPPLTPTHSGSMPAINRVHHCDALTLLKALPDGSVSAIVTSPPYNRRNSTGNGLKSSGGLWTNNAFIGGYGDYSDDMPHDLYIAWQRACLVEMFRVIPPTGAIFYNHSWRVQDGILERLVDEITAGFPVRQIIIWDRGNGFNFNAGYFLPVFEVIYLIAKPDFKLAGGANAYGNVWHIPAEQNKDHPNAFPLELARRCITSTSARFVCDPFMGSGTVAVAARDLGIDWIGSDISFDYVAIAKDRLRTSILEPRNVSHDDDVTTMDVKYGYKHTLFATAANATA